MEIPFNFIRSITDKIYVDIGYLFYDYRFYEYTLYGCIMLNYHRLQREVERKNIRRRRKRHIKDNVHHNNSHQIIATQ